MSYKSKTSRIAGFPFGNIKNISTPVLLLSIFLFSSCASSEKLMQSGKYDEAISVSVKKLIHNNSKEKEILVLEQSFKKVTDRDNDKITFLKKEGTPEIWNSIYDIYSNIKDRQEKIKPLLPLHISSQNRDAKFDLVNIDEEIINAKQNAAKFMYANAMELLDKNNKADARKAYIELIQVKSFYANFRNVDAEISRAKNTGTSYVLFKMQNNTDVPLPPNFEEELYKISLADLDGQWIKYHTQPVKDFKYDYTILVNIKDILVSPESVKDFEYTETKTVPDGFKYVLDARGNVKKDSLGNDMKVPKTKIISCKVDENFQYKRATLAGTLDYLNIATGQLIKTNPISSENIFEYRSATANGDINALKPETAEKIIRKPVFFPTSFDMLLLAGQKLKAMVKDIIYNNKGILF